MYHLRGTLLFLFLITFCSVSRGDGPLIETTGDTYHITAVAYTASVDATGTLTSVIVGGVEFLAPARNVTYGGKPHVLRGINASPMNQWLNTVNLTGNVTPEGHSLRAERDGWWLRYMSRGGRERNTPS